MATADAGPQWPDALRALLDGADLESKIGQAFQLLTVGTDGWPRIALLSAGELLITGPDVMRLALWPGSRTTANLIATQRASLAFALDGGAWLAHLHVGPATEVDIGEKRACFEAVLSDISCDKVAYATVTSGVSFRLTDTGDVVSRWSRTIAALRTAVLQR